MTRKPFPDNPQKEFLAKLDSPEAIKMAIEKMEEVEFHKVALARIEQLFDAEPNTPEGEILDILIDWVCAFEDLQEDIELAKIVEARKDQAAIEVDIDELD